MQGRCWCVSALTCSIPYMASNSAPSAATVARRAKAAAALRAQAHAAHKAEADLEEYREVLASRDDRVRAAHEAGVNIRQIHLLSGLSRSLIYQIIEPPEPEPKPKPKPARRGK